jgi:hypothetical protein
MNLVPEVRREKVFIPPEMTSSEIKEKYGLSSKRAREAMIGWGARIRILKTQAAHLLLSVVFTRTS